MSKSKKDQSFGIIPVHKKEGGEILFCLVKHSGGHWTFPKGHQEEGESKKETALRELKEETGIDKVVLAPNKNYTEKYSFTEKGVTYDKEVEYLVGWTYSTDFTTPDDFKTEISDLKWVTYEEAKSLITFSKAQAILEKVYEDLN